MGTSSAGTTAGNHCNVPLPAGVQDGDLLVIMESTWNSPMPSVPTGWTDPQGVKTSGQVNARMMYHVYHTGESWPLDIQNGGANNTQAVCVALRGVDPSAPLSGYTYRTGSGNSLTIPFLIDGADACWLVGGYGTSDSDETAVPSSFTADGHIGLGGGGNSSTGFDYGPLGAAGTYGGWSATLTGNPSWVSFMLAFKPQLSTQYYQWAKADGIAYEWGYQTDPVGHPLLYRYGESTKGYTVQEYYPASAGGTLSDDNYEIKIYDQDGTLLDDHTFNPGELVEPEVYPCNFTETPVSVPVPATLPAVVTCDVPATDTGIATALCSVKYALNEILGLLTQSAGMAYAYASTLLDSGLTGDQQIAVNYRAYRISITSDLSKLDSWSGSPALYMSPPYLPQIGWVAWDTDQGLVDWQPLMFAENMVYQKVAYAHWLQIHLLPGVTADLYGLTVETV